MATFLARALGLVELPEPPTRQPPDRPGEGVHVIAARADWSSGYFQAELYKLLLEELGYAVLDPAVHELSPSVAYTAMARGVVDFWPNSWYPGHLAWHFAELGDGSLVGEHLSIVGEEMLAGGVQGFLVEKSFADTHGVYTMDELNRDGAALAAFDATDPVPGNGKADIYGCHEAWTCDNIIANMIAFGGWDNINQITGDYDDMFDQAVASVANGIPTVIYTWTPSAYITRLRPGENVYWMGMEQILDDSNPADQPNGDHHDQRSVDGTGGYAAIGADQCPSAADQPSGRCKNGWLTASIHVTANNDFLAANPAARALFEAVELPVIEVSEANVGVTQGRSPTELAAEWVAGNRSLVDEWLDAARAAGPGPGTPADDPADDDPTDPADDDPTDPTDTTTRPGADPAACRPPGPGSGHVTAGFPLPAWASPSIGTFRVGVLFMDFPDAQATHNTRDEAAQGLPYAEQYLEAVSYGRLDVEFVPLHGWLRAPNPYGHYLGERAMGERRVNPSFEAIRLADPSFDFNGIDTVMTVLPSTRFSAGGHLTAAVRSNEKLIRSMAQINTSPRSEPVEPNDWGTIAAHELAHAMGLLDLYPYNRELLEVPEPTDQATWVRSEFGVMGLQASFAADPADLRFKVEWDLPGNREGYSFTSYADAEEMLGWSRWQLGWLDESQVVCVGTDSARVTLGPVADPGDEAAMAVVPLSDTEVLVIESRRKVGYDAEEERTLPDGAVIMVPRLAVEGVLVYTVDASIHSGELPMKLPGDGGDNRIGDYPIISGGERIFVAGYTIGVAPDRGGAHVVQITKGRR